MKNHICCICHKKFAGHCLECNEKLRPNYKMLATKVMVRKFVRCHTIPSFIQNDYEKLGNLIQKLVASKSEVEFDCSLRDVLYQARMNYEMSNLFYQTWIKNSKLYSGLGYQAKCSFAAKSVCAISENFEAFLASQKKVTIDEERC